MLKDNFSKYRQIKKFFWRTNKMKKDNKNEVAEAQNVAEEKL